MQQMRGINEIAKLREELLNFASLIELLDFAEEDVEFADRTHELLNRVCPQTTY
jgi:tRNA modification GTPase